jgi:hypothetical protein
MALAWIASLQPGRLDQWLHRALTTGHPYKGTSFALQPKSEGALMKVTAAFLFAAFTNKVFLNRVITFQRLIESSIQQKVEGSQVAGL